MSVARGEARRAADFVLSAIGPCRPVLDLQCRQDLPCARAADSHHRGFFIINRIGSSAIPSSCTPVARRIPTLRVGNPAVDGPRA